MCRVTDSSVICTLLLSLPVTDSDTFRYSVFSTSESSIIVIDTHDLLRLGVRVIVLVDKLV